MPNGGQADVTMLGVSAEGAGLTKENFNLLCELLNLMLAREK
jgi:hypothetical protein